MPEVSRFFGIVIRMYYREHPPPHLHAKYGEHEVIVYIADRAHEGTFPRRALHLLLTWCDRHRDELFENWRIARLRRPLVPVTPLE